MFAAKRYLSESSAEDVDDPGSDTDHYKHAAGGGDGYGQFKRARMSQDSVDSDHNNDNNSDDHNNEANNSDHNEVNNDPGETETVTLQSASINKPGKNPFF